MGSRNYHYQTPHPQTPHPWTPNLWTIRSISEISSCFCWAETLAHWNPTSCQKSIHNCFVRIWDSQIENSKIEIMETDRTSQLSEVSRRSLWGAGHWIRPISVLRFWMLRGFDPCGILMLRGGTIMSIGNFPAILSQRILVGIILVGRLGVCGNGLYWPGPHVGSVRTAQYIYIYIYIYIHTYIYIYIYT